MSDNDDMQHLDPDQLLTGFSRTPFSATFLLSIILHALIIAAFSLTAIIELVAPQAAGEPETETSEEAVGEDPTETEGESADSADEGEETAETPESTIADEETAEPNSTTETQGTASEASDSFEFDLNQLNR
jgi:hypothetical protein